MSKSNKEITTAFEQFFLKEKKIPSIEELTSFMGKDTTYFKKYFQNIPEVQQELWKQIIFDSIVATQKEAKQSDYSIREVFLSYYYQLIEQLKTRQDYVNYAFCCSSKHKKWEGIKSLHTLFSKAKTEHTAFIKQMLSKGFETGEIVNGKPFISLLIQKSWFNTLLIIKMWSLDVSKEKENTDKLIEKSVNFVMDILERNIVNQSTGFFTFLFKDIILDFWKKDSCCKCKSCECGCC